MSYALLVGSILSNTSSRHPRYVRKLADEIESMRQMGGLRISHHLHLRVETCSETLPEELAGIGADDRVGIVSLMDHTPGDARENATVAAAKRFGETQTSHDDTATAPVQASATLGVRVADFPTTREAARACRDRGVQISMGAPNLVRGIAFR